MPSTAKDISGQKFGRLTVVKRVANRGTRVFFECLCECGTRKEIGVALLRNGATRSCGCYRREATVARRTKHRMCFTPEYQTWATMTRRCRDRNHPYWHRYGGRRISVADVWVNDFLAFYNCVGPRPSKNHSIDRFPDKNGNYEPGNVRWATTIEQANNTSTNKLLVFEERQWTMANLARHCGINYYTLRGMLRSGHAVGEAVSKSRAAVNRRASRVELPNNPVGFRSIKKE